MMFQPFDLPHNCESAEIAGLLDALSHRQRQVLRAYVWMVELGERSVSEWLAADGCPVSERSWYRRGDKASYWHYAPFRAALAAYVRTAQRWLLDQERRDIGRAKSAMIRTAPRAAERIIEQVDGDIGQLFKLVERWTDAPLPTQEIVSEEMRQIERRGGQVEDVRYYLVRTMVLDMAKLREPRYSRLIRKFSDSPRSGISIELYDAQDASETILDRADAATASKTDATFDIGERFESALKRAYGETVIGNQ